MAQIMHQQHPCIRKTNLTNRFIYTDFSIQFYAVPNKNQNYIFLVNETPKDNIFQKPNALHVSGSRTKTQHGEPYRRYPISRRLHKIMAASSVSTSEAKDDNLMENKKPANENYILIDVGANLTNKKFGRDLDAVIQRAKDAGVQKIMVTGTSVHSSKEALRLTRIFPGALYSTAGLHPHDAKSWDETTLAALEELASNPECVAIGECGLDFNRNFSPPDIQIDVFEKQVDLACRVKMPLFVHERDAHEALLSVLDKYKTKLPSVVIHCFTGTREEAVKYLELGFYIGLTGYLWKDKSQNGVRKILEDGVIPLNRLLVETDAPFMYPNTRASKLPANIKDALTEKSLNYLHRYCTFQRNEPCSLSVTVEMIAACMNHTPDQVGLAATYNALKIFGLSN